MPPQPTPWTVRPAKRTAISCDKQQINVPTVKATRDTVKQIGRPNTSLTAAIVGMTTAVAKKYEVPTQKPSVVLPSRAVTIAYDLPLSITPSITPKKANELLTCSDVATMHASSDIMNVIMAKLIIISSSCVDGFHSFVLDSVAPISHTAVRESLVSSMTTF